ALGVVVDDAVRSPVGPKCDLAHASARDEPCAAGQGLGPVRDVGAGLGTDRAAPVAGPAVVARAAAVVGARDDGAVRRPPGPAEPIEAAGHGLAQLADRDRRRGSRRLWRGPPTPLYPSSTPPPLPD